MNRRALFKCFAATAGGLMMPEPVRRYFFAPSGGWGLGMAVGNATTIDPDDFRHWIIETRNGVTAWRCPFTGAIRGQTVDGVPLVPFGFVSFKSPPGKNGLWTVATGSWERPPSYSASGGKP